MLGMGTGKWIRKKLANSVFCGEGGLGREGNGACNGLAPHFWAALPSMDLS